MFVNALLLVGLIGLLFAYSVAVSDLPSRVYTLEQRKFLSHNYGRSVSQQAPTWNIVQSEGQIVPTILPGQESRVRATLAARYEEQGGVSVTVYDLDFHGKYSLTHPGPESTTIQLFFPFPSNLETLHEVRFLVDDEEPAEAQYTVQGITWEAKLEAGEERQIEISYRADGANSFAYSLHHNQRSNVDVVVTVLGIAGSEVPVTSLPTTASDPTNEGETFTWDYENLIADRDIQLTLPTHLSFAQRVARLQDDFRTLAALAPLLIGLFLASLAGVLHLSGIRMRLESYLLIGCCLALFYPMFTFLSGLVNVTLAAILALLLVSGLLVAFLGLAAGWRQTWWRVGLLLVIFLGMFSLGMLTPWRRLLLTAGGLMLVGIFMLHYALRPTTPEPEPAPLPAETILEPVGLYCPYCARALEDDYGFCPDCGHDTSRFHCCAGCGHEQFVPAELEPAHCLHCGQLLSHTQSGKEK